MNKCALDERRSDAAIKRFEEGFFMPRYIKKAALAGEQDEVDAKSAPRSR
jgi:hypothetical protein